MPRQSPSFAGAWSIFAWSIRFAGQSERQSGRAEARSRPVASPQQRAKRAREWVSPSSFDGTCRTCFFQANAPGTQALSLALALSLARPGLARGGPGWGVDALL